MRTNEQNLNEFYSYFELLEPELGRMEREKGRFLEVALTGKEEIEAIVNYASQLNNKHSSFLDLGCGVGNVVLRMALEGYKSYGIDYDRDAIELAEKAREELGINKEVARFAVGNYYPKEMMTDKEGVTLFQKTQKQFRVKKHKQKEQTPEWNSPYDKLGINIRDIDFFYSYPYDNEDMILYIFSKSAKPGAILFLHPVFQDEYIIPPEVDRLEKCIENTPIDVLIKKD